MIIGPASAMIRALGWITVRLPKNESNKNVKLIVEAMIKLFQLT